MKRLAFGLLVAFAAVAALVPSAASSASAGAKEWQVTITNLTPPGSQLLSAPLFVVHSTQADIWSVGDFAARPVAAIAEDANNAPAEARIPQHPGVLTVFTGAGDAIAPGATQTYTVETSGAFNRLTILTMLVNTNDGFTGLDSLHVHGQGTTLETVAYDAGSERNNELAAFIPGPCCNHPFVRDPTHEPIHMHPGITGRGDLDPAVYGWNGPVARIEITRD